MNLTSLREIAKALAAFFSALAASLAAGSATSEGLNAGGTLVALVGAAAAGLLTFSVPNAKPVGARRAVAVGRVDSLDVDPPAGASEPLWYYDPKTGARTPNPPTPPA